jgi:hypothetical protein
MWLVYHVRQHSVKTILDKENKEAEVKFSQKFIKLKMERLEKNNIRHKSHATYWLFMLDLYILFILDKVNIS